MQRGRVVDAGGIGKLEDLLQQAAQAAVGKLQQGWRFGCCAGRLDERCAVEQAAGGQQQLAVGGLPQHMPDVGAGGIEAVGDGAGQIGEARFVGQRVCHRNNDLRHQHIEVAGLSQRTHQFAHRRHQVLGEAGRQHRAEHAQGRAQAAHGDPHLMHVFRIVAAHRAVVVELQMRQAVQRDQAEGRQRRVAGIDRYVAGLDRARGHIEEKPVAAFRLRQQQRRQGLALRQFQGQGVKTIDAARHQLQFKLGDVVAASVRGNPAAVEFDQDARVVVAVEFP